MSADDFQTKYSSFMENMMRSAVEETRKLFETMVDELKAEISKIKKENEDLKTRCSQFEKEKSQLNVYTTEDSCHPGHSCGSEKRDTAVQCDLVPFCTVLVEQSQPLRHSSTQSKEQQYAYERMEYGLQDHNGVTHEEGNSQMSFILVKQEESLSNSTQFFFKQEDVEPPLLCGDNASLTQTSVTGSENEGPLIIKECCTEEMISPQKEEEAAIVLEPPCLGLDSSLQSATIQSPNQEPSQLFSLAALKDDVKAGQKISVMGTREEVPTSEAHQLLPQQCQRNGQTSVTLQQFADVHYTEEPLAGSTLVNEEVELGNTEAEGDTSSIHVLVDHHKSGRSPKKRNQKEIFLSSSADERRDNKGLNNSNLVTDEGIEVSSRVLSKEASLVIAPSVQGRATIALERDEHKIGSVTVSVISLSSSCSSEPTDVSSADETWNTEPVESPEAASVQFREACTPVSLQDAMLLVEAMNQSTVDDEYSPQRIASTVTRGSALVSTSEMVDKTPAETPQLPEETEFTVETPVVTDKIKDYTSTNEAPAHFDVALPKQHTFHPFNTATSPISSSTAATQTTAQLPRHPLVKSTAPSVPSKSGPHTIILVPRFRSQKIAESSPCKISTTVSAAVRSNTLLPSSRLVLPPETQSFALPDLPSQSVTTSADQQSAIPHPKINIVSRQTTEPENPMMESISTPQKLFVPASNLQKRNNAMANPESFKQTSPVGLVPASNFPETVEQKLSAMVRLTRLPFSISTTSSVSVSKLLSEGYSEAFTPKKPSKGRISHTEMPHLSSDVHSSLPEKCTSVCLNTCGMLEESNNIQEKSSLAPETCAILEEAPTLSSVSVRGLVKSAEVSSMTEHLVEPSMAGETPSPDSGKETMNTEVQEKQSAVMPKDASDPHLQMNKTQFLAELAVSPAVQAPKKASASDPEDARASVSDASSCDKKILQKNSLMAALRSHMKTHSQAKRNETKSDALQEAETNSAKKSRINNDNLNDVKGVSLNRMNNSSFISPRRSRLCKDSLRLKRCANEPASVHSRMSKAASDSRPLSSWSPDSKSTSVSPKRSRSAERSASANKSKMNSVSPEGSISSRVLADCKNKKSSESVRRPSSTDESESHSVGPGNLSLTTANDITERTSNVNYSTVKCSEITNSIGAKKTGSPAKPRLIRERAGSKMSLRVANAMKLTAKAKTVVRIKNSNKLKMHTCQTPQNQTNCEVVRKCKTNGVWFPPIMDDSETPSEEENGSSLLPVKTETSPHCISFQEILARSSPIVSPLQPLSVIGRHLLRNQCGECGRILSSSAALESHVSLHTGCRPFSCTLCGKNFPDSKGLKRHGRVHRNGKIHICPQCGKGFVYSFGLTKHLQMVHSRIKPFICQICNKGFFTKRDVEVHIRSHTGEKPFHCHLCDKKFIRRVELNVHIRWHIGEKRHWCPYCGKGFLDYNNLKRHKYIHTGEKPHPCPHCPKHFTQTGHLKKHVKNVHKIK
ncbi:uncharacterized protein LOC125000686 [Mugil cephalus]|uniref:uncharacterized protein LOC125000686 n=1 Tax=Mugil cephalus TaxID=48193 RepID=UPI001FB780CE|nr:uncharacterized protein LOC125000686 [Mugil cephalus]